MIESWSADPATCAVCCKLIILITRDRALGRIFEQFKSANAREKLCTALSRQENSEPIEYAANLLPMSRVLAMLVPGDNEGAYVAVKEAARAILNKYQDVPFGQSENVVSVVGNALSIFEHLALRYSKLEFSTATNTYIGTTSDEDIVALENLLTDFFKYPVFWASIRNIIRLTHCSLRTAGQVCSLLRCLLHAERICTNNQSQSNRVVECLFSSLDVGPPDLIRVLERETQAISIGDGTEKKVTAINRLCCIVGILRSVLPLLSPTQQAHVCGDIALNRSTASLEQWLGSLRVEDAENVVILNDEIISLREQTNELDAAFVAHNETKQSLEAEVTDLREILQHLETDVAKQTKTKEGLEAEVTNLRGIRQQLEADVAVQTKAKEGLDADVAKRTETKQRLEAVQHRLEADVAVQTKAKEGLDADTKAKEGLDTDVAKRTETKQRLEAEVTKLRGNRQQLEADVAAQTKAKKGLEVGLAAKQIVPQPRVEAKIETPRRTSEHGGSRDVNCSNGVVSLPAAEPKYYSSNNHHVYELPTNTGEVIIAAKNVNGNGRLVVLRKEHETHSMVLALRDQLQLRQHMVVTNDSTEFAEKLKSGKKNAP
eukprot:gene35594-46162_t